MATFPALIPSTRTYSPGTFPHTAHRTYGGGEVRVRHSNVVTGVRLRLFFPAISTAELLQIKAHHSGQLGGLLPFTIPAELLSGMDTPADFTPVGQQWVYAGRVQVKDIPIQGTTPSNRHDVTVELEAVPSKPGVLVPRVAMKLSALAPTVGGTPNTVDVPSVAFTLTPKVPTVANVIIPLRELELLFEGTNGSTTFLDTGLSAATVTAFNGATISTATAAQGSASGSFIRSSGSYLSLGSLSALDFGTGDFRVSFRARFAVLPGTVPGTYTVIRGINSGSLEIRFTSANAIGIVRPGVGNDYDTPPLTIAVNTWYAFVVARTGTTITVTQDGVNVGTGTGLGAAYNLGSGGTYIGGNAGSTNFDGHLDELFIE